MDQDLSELEARIEQLLAVVRRLSEQNQSMRADLEQASTKHTQLKARMGEARTRVQAVLDRLPRNDEAQLPLGLVAETPSMDPGRDASDNPASH